jgi:molybdate/tungstate transport system ATP-binding protein
MSFVAVDGLSLRLGAFALRDISFTLERGETFVILGPSGAGKSVLLEMLAGFYLPDSGRIHIDDRDVTGAPPEARRLGFMFQDYALFPHLTVAQNILFGLQHSGHSRNSRQRSEELLTRLGLTALAARKITHLSGGEKQRVALARALATEPALFLFDEPLSALDARTRDALREELKSLLHHLGVTTIYVTHDQAEALVLADKMAVLREGALVQLGTPSEIFNTPADEFVANFVGVETVLAGEIIAALDGMLRIAIGHQVLHALDEGVTGNGRKVLACIRPEDVALARAVAVDSSVRNQFPARVVAVAPLGPLFKITLDAGFPLVAYVTKQSYLELGLVPGAPTVASVKATAVHLIGR